MDIEELKRKCADFPEINMNNFDVDDVAALNGWGIEVALMLPAIVAKLEAAQKNAIPDGYVVVPVEPTEEQWGELARDIMFVLRQERPTPRKLLYHLEHLHETLPDWLRNESEMQNLDHVISKGTCCVLIYKAMIAAKAE